MTTQRAMMPLVLAAATCWQPAAGLNASCADRAHCHWAAPLSKYVCGFSTASPLIAAGYPRVTVNGSEMLISNASCTTTVVPECAPATGSSGDCAAAGACTFVAAGADPATDPATCTTTEVPECAAVDMDTASASDDCATAGACTHNPAVWTEPNVTYATVFLLCTLGAERGCTGANYGTPECELPAGAVRESLTSVQRTVGGDPHLDAHVLAELGLTAAQFETQYGMTAAEFGSQSVSNNWKAAIASLQCETNCMALEDRFEDDCLTMANAKGTVKEASGDGLDLCDHRACESSLLAIKQALMYDC